MKRIIAVLLALSIAACTSTPEKAVDETDPVQDFIKQALDYTRDETLKTANRTVPYRQGLAEYEELPTETIAEPVLRARPRPRS